MNESELMQAIMSKLESIDGELKAVNNRLDTLEEGQKAIRRDVARIDRKLDRLANDVGDTLAIIPETTDYELSKLREAK